MLGLKINLKLFIACLGPLIEAVPPDFPPSHTAMADTYGATFRTLPLPTELSD